jgi:hypothetical protein
MAKSRLFGLIQQHPLASFFVLAYAISWLLWAPLVVSRSGSPKGLGLDITCSCSRVADVVEVARGR